MTLIKSISGIRGIVNNGLDYITLKKFVLSFIEIQKAKTILIARDGRTHGLEFSNKISDFLSSIGKTVVKCEVIPTPTAQFIVEKNKYCGGIVITASHNPSEWNGLKFIDKDGCFINSSKYQKLINKVNDTESNKSDFPLKNNGSVINYKEQAIRKHLNNILNLSVINIKKIKSKKYKIVIDAINASTSKIIPLLLKEFSCEITTLNCKEDGDFNRGAEPLPENLSELSKKVIETKSDLGIATDPDGDRLAIVDEKGRPIGEEATLVLCCEGLLINNQINGPIITNLSTSMAIDELSKKYNIKVLRTNVGEINVVNKMKKTQSIIGGEGNGGVILTESHYGRDSLVATALLLNRLSLTSKKLSELYQEIPNYEIIKDFIKSTKNLNEKFLDLIKKEFNPPKINQMDGIKLIWPDKWIHVRKSNTEPIIRFYSEAHNYQDAIELINKAKNIFQN